MKKLLNTIFPVNKRYYELEKPVQDLLGKRMIEGVGIFILSVIMWFLPRFDLIFKGMFTFLSVLILGICINTWYLFISDSLYSLEGTFQSCNEKKKSAKLYIVKDGVKVCVNYKGDVEDLSVGDKVKFYTTSSNIEEKNGMVYVSNVLVLFVTKSKENDGNEENE